MRPERITVSVLCVLIVVSLFGNPRDAFAQAVDSDESEVSDTTTESQDGDDALAEESTATEPPEVAEAETSVEDDPTDPRIAAFTEVTSASPVYVTGGIGETLSIYFGDMIRLRPSVFIQIRYLLNYRQNPSDGEETTVNFNIPRARFALDWDLTKYLTFRFRAGQTSGSDRTLQIEQAWGDVQFKWFRLRVGQFRLPIWGEQQTGAPFLLSADRAPTATVFDSGQSLAMMLTGSYNDFRGYFAYSYGLGSGYTEYGDPVRADIAFTARVEYRLGETGWARFRDFTSFEGSDTAALFGLSGHYQSGGKTDLSANINIGVVNIDGRVEGDGWNGFAQFTWQRKTGDEYYDAIGVIAQAGVFVSPRVEMFIRLDGNFPFNGDPDPDLPGPGRIFRTSSLGLNVYMFENAHNAKFTWDALYFMDPQVPSLVETNINSGLFATTTGGQWATRFQLDLSI